VEAIWNLISYLDYEVLNILDPPPPNQVLVDQGGFIQALIVVLPKKKHCHTKI
jgi:hypothetical protein